MKQSDSKKNNQRIFVAAYQAIPNKRIISRRIFLYKKLDDLDTYCVNKRIKYDLCQYFENINSLTIKKIKELRADILMFEKRKRFLKKGAKKKQELKKNKTIKQILRDKEPSIKVEVSQRSIRTISAGLPGQGKRR